MKATKSGIAQGAIMIWCAAVGFGISYWINRPDPPWLLFNEVRAYYVEGTNVVKVSGTYTARKSCAGAEPNRPPSLIWRQEVEGSKDSPVVQYAPQPAAPGLEIGTHEFEQEIRLRKDILPDGWVVAILVTCKDEIYTIRSKATKVEFVKPGRAQAAGTR